MTDREMKQMQARTILACQIRFWMRRFNMDVKKLAEITELAPKTIYRLRAGDVGASTDSIADIAAAFDVPLSIMLTPLPVDNGSDDE